MKCAKRIADKGSIVKISRISTSSFYLRIFWLTIFCLHVYFGLTYFYGQRTELSEEREEAKEGQEEVGELLVQQKTTSVTKWFFVFEKLFRLMNEFVYFLYYKRFI